MRQQLSAIELVNKLNEGGWKTQGGHELKHSFQKLPVENAYQRNGTAWITVSGGRAFEVTTSDVRINEPWRIDIYQNYVRRCQRKEVEGGGWHEIPVPCLALRLTNPEMEKVICKDRAEQARQREREKRQREAEAREAARQRFVAKLTSDFVGKMLMGISVSDGNLYLEFAGGPNLLVEAGGGDYLDEAWITVNQTPLREFTSPEDEDEEE